MVRNRRCSEGVCASLVLHVRHLIHAYRVVVDRVDFRFTIRWKELGVLIARITPHLSTYERGEFRGSATDLGQKHHFQGAHSLVDSVLIGGAFHVTCDLASKTGDEHYDLALGVVGGGHRELVNLILCLF